MNPDKLPDGWTDAAVDVTDVTSWLQLYKLTGEQITALEEKRQVAREHIEAALGDNETGTLNGAPVVRWSFVTSKRLDQKKAKELLGDRVDEAMVEGTSRRFALVEQDA